MFKRTTFLAILVAALPLASCLQVDDVDPGREGNFLLLTTSVSSGQQWALNRPIVMTFNHAVDPATVDFSTIQFRPMANGYPVTGQLEVSTDGFQVTFYPNCGVSENFDDGGFVHSSEYELFIPSFNTTDGAYSVLRDSQGRGLERGAIVGFHTPTIYEPLFQDFVSGPPEVTALSWPSGLNLFSHSSEGAARVHLTFNQSIDARSSNLNTNNIYVLYSEGEIGTIDELSFPADNRIPGYIELVANCVDDKAYVDFVAIGVLPPNRNLKLIIDAAFSDITGQISASDYETELFAVTTLAKFFAEVPDAITGDPEPFDPRFAVQDEFLDNYLDSSMVDLESGLPLPMAEVGPGFVGAAFDFPGEFVSEDDDFYWTSGFADIYTVGNEVFVDSRNNQIKVTNGVIYVNDFFIEEGSQIRGMGDNPLVIYATGEVTIDGILNVNGDNAHQPSSLNSPNFAEGGAVGRCGGGDGGTASQITDSYTPRGENGDGPFDQEGAGGQGGEGCFQQTQGLSATSYSTDDILRHIQAAGGGGGTFAMTSNYAINKDDWLLGNGHSPESVDNSGPDHHPDHHTGWTWDVIGGEAGMRGTAFNSQFINPQNTSNNDPRGAFGMEDRQPDVFCEDVTDNAPFWNEPWLDTMTFPPFLYGHPTLGPDPGSAGATVFSPDGNTGDDFWGSRLNPDGTVTTGELLMPWAGSGGGASGDSQRIPRVDIDGDDLYEPLEDFFPVATLAEMTAAPNNYYQKGAPGGAGGGQVLIFAIGKIKIGEMGAVTARGGNGTGGESLNWFYTMVSGSGGGSGGHIVLQSSTGLDISELFVGAASNQGQLAGLVPTEAVSAFGGRRGWSGAHIVKVPGDPSKNDGNGTFQVGRGGAGGNGIIQIHVPDVTQDIDWPAAAAAPMSDYVASLSGDPIERAEEMLNLVCAPTSLCLVPMFSSKSMFMSRWIDTGLAGLRVSESIVDGTSGEFQYLDFPAYDDLVLAEGFANAGGVTFLPNQIEIDASMHRVPQRYKDSPELFLADFGVGEHLVFPDAEMAEPQTGFVITGASYLAGDRFVLDTDPLDGDMTAVATGNKDWQVRMSSQISFSGISSADGFIEKSEGNTVPLSEVATGSTNDLDIQFFEVELNSASQSVSADFLRNPALLYGYDLYPDADGQLGFAMVDVSYNPATDTLSFLTDPTDGAPSLALNAARPTWSLRRKFFQVATTGVKNAIPDSVEIAVEFQGAHESYLGSDVPGVPLPSASLWTSDLKDLQGCRYLRYRVLFNIDAQDTGVDLASPRSNLGFIKIPIQW